MDERFDPDPLDELVQAVVDEVLARLGIGSATPVPAPAHDADSRVCAECDGRCVWSCADRVHRVMDAGADRVSSSAGLPEVEPSIARLIDHTLLKPDATRAEIEALCREAVRYGFAAVCVNPWHVPLAAARVRGSEVRVCAVVGFPLGATLTRVKVFEAEEAIKLGAQELDMVMNVGALKSGDEALLAADIRAVVEATHRGGALCNVIIETALLTKDEKVRASVTAALAGADFVKTSTGFASSGATAEDVALIRAAVGRSVGVKAAGGIRTLANVQAMAAAGATRIGASAGVRIFQQSVAASASR